LSVKTNEARESLARSLTTFDDIRVTRQADTLVQVSVREPGAHCVIWT
jgi:hypothetical protein